VVLAAAFALTGSGAQMFAEDLARNGESAGATQAAFETQSKSFAFQMKTSKTRWARIDRLREYHFAGSL